MGSRAYITYAIAIIISFYMAISATNSELKAIASQKPIINKNVDYQIRIVPDYQDKKDSDIPPQVVSIEDKIIDKFGKYGRLALAIARCESSLNEKAVGDKNLNPSSYGLFQIRAFKGRPSPEDLLIADKNIDYAYEMSKGGTNWNAWSCYTQKDVKGHNAGNPYYYKHLSD
jgi:soluble lytic murein transglycosylase-like protein